NLDLDAGVLREPLSEDNRIVLWLPGDRAGGFQHWERVGNVPGAEVSVAQGLCATAATLVRARQQVGGFFAKLVQRFRKPGDNATWVLPSGETAEQVGDRQTDLLLVWPDQEAVPVEEAQLQARWSQAKRFRKIGKALFLVAGVEPPSARADLAPAPQGAPR